MMGFDPNFQLFSGCNSMAISSIVHEISKKSPTELTVPPQMNKQKKRKWCKSLTTHDRIEDPLKAGIPQADVITRHPFYKLANKAFLATISPII